MVLITKCRNAQTSKPVFPIIQRLKRKEAAPDMAKGVKSETKQRLNRVKAAAGSTSCTVASHQELSVFFVVLAQTQPVLTLGCAPAIITSASQSIYAKSYFQSVSYSGRIGYYERTS